MKTVRIINIDGYDVIGGFGELTIDPMATRVKIENDIKKEPEFKLLDMAIEKLNRIKKNIYDAKNESDGIVQRAKTRYTKANPGYSIFKIDNDMINKILSEKEKEIIARNIVRLGNFFEEHEKAGTEKTEAVNKLAEKSKSLFNESPVYFEPANGEKVIDAEAFENLTYLILMNPDSFVTIIGDLICDKRGVEYVENGSVKKVEFIGKEPSGPLLKDLTPEELETMRLDAMTSEEKQYEYNMAVDGLAGSAAAMRAKLEIQGDSEALIKAQEWYNAEVDKIKIKYSIV